MEDQEDDRNEGQGPMELDRQEPRPGRGLRPGDRKETEAGDRAEQDQRDDAAATGGEPEDLRAHWMGSGQPLRRVTAPDVATRRAGYPA